MSASPDALVASGHLDPELWVYDWEIRPDGRASGGGLGRHDNQVAAQDAVVESLRRLPSGTSALGVITKTHILDSGYGRTVAVAHLDSDGSISWGHQ